MKRCLPCQKRKPFDSGSVARGMRAPVSGLFDTVSVDFAGPLPRAMSGSRRLLIAVERLTGWPIVVAMPAATSYDVAMLIENHILRPYQAPKIMLADNDQAFKTPHLKAFAKQKGFEALTAAAYSPQANGKAERMAQTIKNGIAKLADDQLTTWDQYVDKVLRGYRLRGARGHPSPFYLMFDIEPRILPTDQVGTVLQLPVSRALEIAEVNAIREERKRGPGETAAQRFKVGDWALMPRSSNKLKLNLKLATRWEGPCQALKAAPPTCLLFSEGNRRARMPMHERRLRLYASNSSEVLPH